MTNVFFEEYFFRGSFYVKKQKIIHLLGKIKSGYYFCETDHKGSSTHNL